jgi:dihydrofolate reductase
VIRAIVALDTERGIATDRGIPWRLPADQRRFRELTEGSAVIMGYNTYAKFRRPLQNRRNYVWCQPKSKLMDGFEPVHELTDFLATTPDDLWIIGGGHLYAAALAYCQELYITKVGHNYGCTVFFPEFSSDFALISESWHQYDDITYSYQLWRR